MTKKQLPSLLILSLIAGLVYLTPFLRFSFYDQMKEALQISDLQMGSIGFIYGLFNVLGYIPTGFIAEKFSTKKMLILSCLGMAVTTIWYSTFPDFWCIMVIHALYGVFSVWTFWSPYLKAIRSLASDQQQSTIYGLSEGIRGVGQTIVSFLCLAALGSMVPASLGFRIVLWINIAVFILLMCLTIFLIPDLDHKKSKKRIKKAENFSRSGDNSYSSAGNNPTTLETLKEFPKLLKYPGTWICIAVIMCAYCLWNTINGYLGTYTTRVLSIPTSLSSTLSIIRSYLIVFIAGFTGGFMLDKFRLRGKGLLLFFLCAAACSIGLCFFVPFVALSVLLTLVLAYVINVLKATYWSILGDAGIPREKTGAATGVISLIALTPDFFTSPIISRFITYGEQHGNAVFGFRLMFVWILVWSAAGIIGCWVLCLHSESLRVKAAVRTAAEK